MRLGISLPQAGSIAGPEAIRRVAQRAEAVGYESVWVLDRLLYPLVPKTPYPASADGRLPDGARWVLDAVGTLTYAAACTERVKLGSSIINAPLYNPVLLARELTTLDILSSGRLRVGFGMGWSVDEYEAASVDMSSRGARTDELLDVLQRLWAPGPSEHKGKIFSVPRSEVLKPVQAHIPVYLAAYTPAAMKRVAERADGWNPAGIPIEGMKVMFANVRDMAQAAGRDPSTLELIVRANLHVTPASLPKSRPIFAGSLDQIREDMLATQDLGAHELLIDPQFISPAPSLSTYLELLEQLYNQAR